MLPHAALESLGFGSYITEVKDVLQECKTVALKRRKASSRLENLGIPEEELLRQQQELFAKVGAIEGKLQNIACFDSNNSVTAYFCIKMHPNVHVHVLVWPVPLDPAGPAAAGRDCSARVAADATGGTTGTDRSIICQPGSTDQFLSGWGWRGGHVIFNIWVPSWDSTGAFVGRNLTHVQLLEHICVSWRQMDGTVKISAPE